MPVSIRRVHAACAGRGGGGRGAVGYRSVVGEPGQGVPIETRGGGPGRAGAAPAPRWRAWGARGAARRAACGRAPRLVRLPPRRPAPRLPATGGGGGGGGRGAAAANAGIPGARDGGGPGGGFARPSGVVYAVASDGMLHVLGLQSGKDIQQPARFLPPNARWTDAVAVGTFLYAATSGNCGGAPSGVYAVDLDSDTKPIMSWHTNGGSVVGPVAFGTDGTVIVAVGPGQVTGDGKANAIVALDPKTLQIKDWFTQPNAEFVTGPTIFRHNDRDIVAAATTRRANPAP